MNSFFSQSPCKCFTFRRLIIDLYQITNNWFINPYVYCRGTVDGVPENDFEVIKDPVSESRFSVVTFFYVLSFFLYMNNRHVIVLDNNLSVITVTIYVYLRFVTHV